MILAFSPIKLILKIMNWTLRQGSRNLDPSVSIHPFVNGINSILDLTPCLALGKTTLAFRSSINGSLYNLVEWYLRCVISISSSASKMCIWWPVTVSFILFSFQKVTSSWLELTVRKWAHQRIGRHQWSIIVKLKFNIDLLILLTLNHYRFATTAGDRDKNPKKHLQ